MNFEQLLKFLINMVVNLILLLVLAGLLIHFTKMSFGFGNEIAQDFIREVEPMDIEVELDDDLTIDEIADILEEKGVIKSALLFKVENLLKGNNYTFDGGTYTLNTRMDASEIVSSLLTQNLVSTDIIITISEGFTVKDISEYLESKDIVSAEEFMKACNESEFNYSFLRNIPERENRLEGYLFPDTYYILENSTPEMIINKMLVRFEEIYGKYEYQVENMGMTMDEIITIASIIEKEILVDSERAMAAEVIYNRLNNGENLGMCSTVLYVTDKRRDRILESDLQIESPYNTYINPGLPVGPISNPGEACIAAAVYPSEGDLYYFVVKDDESGEHVFTNDYNEFLAAKELYNQRY